MKISASEQVQEWLIALAPERKRRVRAALRTLTEGKGDLQALQGCLEGFNRLRVGGLRIIYRQTARQVIRLEYANTRDVLYELFQRYLDEIDA